MKIFSLINYMLSICLILFSLFIYYNSMIFLNKLEFILEWEVISLNSFSINLVFIFDTMSLYFISLVSLISGSVMMFSNSYMTNEKFFSRFIMLVFFFIMSMYLLILSPNLISLLLGWDGLGVTSYLLVIFYQSNKSYNAGMLTAMTNRLGDVGLLISISMFMYMGSWTYLYINFLENSFSNLFIYIIIISSMTKSAQIPFSAWLPAAMAAPTPVSALVHSSTLVTAGVYLLIRMNMIIINMNMSNILMLIGMLTMVMAGMTAMMEMDMKKIIALSTLSQLGVMMMILGAGSPMLSFFHLISHAFFKAMLFMCAGLIIHNMKDYQDIRKMGFSYNNLNYSISIMMIANMSLCGLPFLSGFYSKDLIIEMMFMKGKNIFILFLLFFGTMLTIMYSCRLNFLVALNFMKMESYFYMSESSKDMLMGMSFLLPFSIFGGMMISWNIMSVNKLIFLPFWMKISIFMLIIFSISLFYYIYNESLSVLKNKMIWFFSNMWFLPMSFSISLTSFSLNYSNFVFKNVEMSWSELIIFKNFYKSMNYFFSKFMDFFSFMYMFQTMEIFILMFLFLYLII